MTVLDDRLDSLLDISADRHKHLRPRQVLGVRIGMLAAELLDLELPQTNKRLLTLVETDGCFADGVSAATGCWLGRRTMRLVDFGKVAATFIDTRTGESVRVHPSPEVRALAARYAPEQRSRWHTYLEGYKRMPASELLRVERVRLVESFKDIVSRPGMRVNCTMCGEEILNQREIVIDSEPFCKGCAGQSYYIQKRP